MPDVSLNGIEFTIKGSSDAASSSIETLNSNLQALRSSLSSASGMTAFANGIKKLGDAINGLGSSGADKAASTLEKVAKSVSTFSVFGDVAKSVGSFSRSLTKLAENPDGLEQVSEILSEISLIDFTNIQQAGEGLRNIAAASKDIANINPAAKSAKQGIKGIAEETKRATGPLANFVASLKRIAFYRILRSILKSISQALQEGLKNAYEYSKLTGGELSASLDLISTKSLTMKNQLGAAFGSLIVAVTPILIQIIQIVNAVASAITRLIAILGGKSTWTRAKDVWTEWGEAAGGAGGAAKEALKYLAPFDELNRLPDESGRGGGGGANTPDYSEMFETVSTDVGAGLLDSITDAFTSLGDWFEGKDWSDLGSKAWDGLIDALKDSGKASAAVSAISEALGAAIGGATAFASGFISSAVSSIYEKFKEEIRDYNGNDKIDITDILHAAWNTVTVGRNWIDNNIVNPFMKGIIQGFSSANYEPSNEEVSAFSENFKAMMLKMFANPSGFLIDLSLTLTALGLSEISTESIGHEHTTGSFKVEAEADVIQWNDRIPKSDKVIDGMDGKVSKAIDNIPAKDKQIETTADYRHWAIKGTVDPAMSSAKYKNWTTWDSTLDYRHWAIKGTVDPKASSNAYKGWTTWDSTLNYNKWAIKGTVNPKGNSDVYKDWTTWDSTANFNKQKNSLGTPSIDSIANLINYTLARAIQNGANQLVVSAVASIVNAVTGGGKASGGAYYGGSWHSIPQYASGGRPHGTMFWAGEAGPEVVGHVGGRTEVLNQSQLAATMYASVSAALSGLRFAMTAPAAPDGSMGGSDDALYNAFVRALESADFAVDNTINMDGDTVYRGVVRRNQQRRRQLGYNPMLT